MSDPSLPTYSSGTFSKISGTSVFNVNNDSSLPGGTNGYQNEDPNGSVGGFNNNFNTRVNSPTAPIAGVNGKQS